MKAEFVKKISKDKCRDLESYMSEVVRTAVASSSGVYVKTMTVAVNVVMPVIVHAVLADMTRNPEAIIEGVTGEFREALSEVVKLSLENRAAL